MNNWRAHDQETGGSLYLDGAKYRFRDIIETSRIGRTTLASKRAKGILWVFKDARNVSRGDWIKYALYSNTPRAIPRAFVDVILITREMEHLIEGSGRKRRTNENIGGVRVPLPGQPTI